MALAHSPKIITSGLNFVTDSTNPKSYSGGSTLTDLINSKSYNIDLVNGGTNIANADVASYMNNITAITIDIWLEKTSTVVGYAFHPVNKWNAGTTEASFVLYHFGTTSGSDNFFNWYGTGSLSGWSTLSDGFYGVNGRKYNIVLQYSSANGGQNWVNGAKNGGRITGKGTLGVAASPGVFQIQGPNEYFAGHKVLAVKVYNRELSDNEIVQNFNALQGRFGI
jgi:hypothetical protein